MAYRFLIGQWGQYQCGCDSLCTRVSISDHIVVTKTRAGNDLLLRYSTLKRLEEKDYKSKLRKLAVVKHQPS